MSHVYDYYIPLGQQKDMEDFGFTRSVLLMKFRLIGLLMRTMLASL